MPLWLPLMRELITVSVGVGPFTIFNAMFCIGAVIFQIITLNLNILQ